MTVKNAARYNRICKPRKSPASVVGLITENVFVPITKPVVVQKDSIVRTRFSDQRATNTIPPRKRDSGDATIPLLKQPSRQLSKRIHSQEKKRTSKDQRNPTLPLFKYNTTMLRRPRDDKISSVLPFPSPISVSNASPIPDQLPPPKRRKTCKNRVEPYRRYGESAQMKARLTVQDRVVVSATNSFISITSSNLSNVVEIDTETPTRRALSDLQTIDWLSTDTLTTAFDKAIRLLETDSIGIPVAVTVAATPARISEVSTTEAEAEATTEVTTTATDVCRSLFNVFDVDKLIERCDESRKKFDDTDSSIVPNAPADHSSECYESRKKCDGTDCSIVPNGAIDLSEAVYPCKPKYSWQVLGKNIQTSRTLLEHLLQETFDDTPDYACSIKYSWQIIGIGTQTSKEDLVASRFSVRLDVARTVDGTSSKSSSKPSSKPSITSPATNLPRRSLNKAFLKSTQGTQTCAHKEIQTNLIDFYAE